jgi:hypothetical protein
MLASKSQKDYKDSKTSGLVSSLAVNNLIYKLPKSLTNSVNSTLTKQYFQKRTYRGNESAICILNSGNDFVNWGDSFLFMRVKTIAPNVVTPGQALAGFGVGSAMNLISEIKVSSRSGTELARIQRANFINNIRAKWTYSTDWFQTIGSVMGFGATADVLADDAEVAFAIPMSLLCGFFRPEKNQSCPPQLASGLNIEILFANAPQALVESGAGETGVITDYEVTDIHIATRSITRQDSVSRAITQQSASQGLDYHFPRNFSTTDLGASGSTSQEIQLQKAVSFCRQATIVPYPEAGQNDIAVDSFVTAGYTFTSAQFRVGSVYLPQQALASSLDSDYGAILGYIYSQKAFMKLQHLDKPNSVNVSDYTDGSTGATCISSTLEKSLDLQLSGLALNNSRILNVSLQMDALSANTVFLTFIEYDSVSKVYLNNTSQKE